MIKKVHLIACGGTAMTLLGIKASTKDIDLIVAEPLEHEYLVSILKQLGYKQATGSGWSRDDGFIFDLFKGQRVHTTELLESPLKTGNHILVKELNHIYLGVLNYYDIMISKLFRGSSIDFEDCLALFKKEGSAVDLERLKERFQQTASFDISEDKVMKHLAHFLKLVGKEGRHDES